MKQTSKKEQKPICAFGLSEEGICFVRIAHNTNNSPTLNTFEFLPGEPGVHSIILKQLTKQHKLKKINCATYLDNSDYQLIVTDAPSVPKEDLINALRWSIKDTLTISTEEATLDIFEAPDQTTAKKTINVVSAKKSKISELNTLFKDARLSLTIIDIEELALRNLAMLGDQDENGVVLLWLTKNNGKILFIRKGNLYLSRNIELGYESVRSSDVSLENIALELQRSIDYFERHFSQVPMKHLILMPTIVELPNLASFLNANLSIPCQEYKLQKELSNSTDLTDEDIAKHLITLGTALRQESDIN